mgnify:FL=1|jgi:rare lipoprotein A
MKHPYLYYLLFVLALLFSFSVQAQRTTRRGKASFYSKKATGARTSSGERLHHDSLTCAHRSLPFGTRLKVTNLRNGKSVIVRVTDRGPHHRNRIIDLSYGAARELGMLSQGIAMVEVERVEKVKVPYREDAVETGLPEFDFDMAEVVPKFIKQNPIIIPKRPATVRPEKVKLVRNRKVGSQEGQKSRSAE